MFGLLGGVNFRTDDEKGTVANFDGANAATESGEAGAEYDSLANVALASDTYALRQTAIYVALQLIEDLGEGDLDDDELPSDRMDSLIAGAVGDEEDEDGMSYQLLSAQVEDVFLSLGVDSSTVDTMFSDDVTTADAAIEAACEAALANLPAEGEDLDTFIEEFVYGFDGAEFEDDHDLESDFDSTGKRKTTVGKTTVRKNKFGQTLRYKGVKVIRHGKVKVINKRVAGGAKVRLSAKQKAALRKASVKARTGSAMRKRLRSWKKGQKMGLNKV